MTNFPIYDTGDTSPATEINQVASSLLMLMMGLASRYVALLAAWLATGGSLFFSEVLGWVPCTLCWYQRILMYPLSILLAIGILRRDDGLHRYVLPFSLLGVGVSLYHYLLIKTDWFPPPPCRSGIPCTVDYLDIFGFINIPFMALTAFLIISLMMVISRFAPFDDTDTIVVSGGRAFVVPRIHMVCGIIAVVVVVFIIGSWLL
jgi:disulfide bond formation protein DsbB